MRLAALPLFLVLAYSSGDGTSFAAAMVFWLIAAGDYLDGFLARVTGQYSRMGALLDPLVDRLTILSGAVVCWSFELLPHWRWSCWRCASWRCSFSPSTASGTGSTSKSTGPGGSRSSRSWGGSGWRSSPPAGWRRRCVVWGTAMAILATVMYARTGVRTARARAAS